MGSGGRALGSGVADGGSRTSSWDVYAAQEVVARAERALKLLMLSDLQDRFWAPELIPVDAPDTTPGAFDVARALADARKNRPEIAELTAQVSQQDVALTLARDG